nr:PREDICTED: uncharacterized protein LOC102364618 [Latimeria chalumnae]|eukprot:XP_014344176.1 PREDICTED: uncharacterized protein LOC102364618 [Latimeria chalumnae]
MNEKLSFVKQHKVTVLKVLCKKVQLHIEGADLKGDWFSVDQKFLVEARWTHEVINGRENPLWGSNRQNRPGSGIHLELAKRVQENIKMELNPVKKNETRFALNVHPTDKRSCTSTGVHRLNAVSVYCTDSKDLWRGCKTPVQTNLLSSYPSSLSLSNHLQQTNLLYAAARPQCENTRILLSSLPLEAAIYGKHSGYPADIVQEDNHLPPSGGQEDCTRWIKVDSRFGARPLGPDLESIADATYPKGSRDPSGFEGESNSELSETELLLLDINRLLSSPPHVKSCRVHNRAPGADSIAADDCFQKPHAPMMPQFGIVDVAQGNFNFSQSSERFSGTTSSCSQGQPLLLEDLSVPCWKQPDSVSETFCSLLESSQTSAHLHRSMLSLKHCENKQECPNLKSGDPILARLLSSESLHCPEIPQKETESTRAVIDDQKLRRSCLESVRSKASQHDDNDLVFTSSTENVLHSGDPNPLLLRGDSYKAECTNMCSKYRSIEHYETPTKGELSFKASALHAGILTVSLGSLGEFPSNSIGKQCSSHSSGEGGGSEQFDGRCSNDNFFLVTPSSQPPAGQRQQPVQSVNSKPFCTQQLVRLESELRGKDLERCWTSSPWTLTKYGEGSQSSFWERGHRTCQTLEGSQCIPTVPLQLSLSCPPLKGGLGEQPSNCSLQQQFRFLEEPFAQLKMATGIKQKALQSGLSLSDHQLWMLGQRGCISLKRNQWILSYSWKVWRSCFLEHQTLRTAHRHDRHRLLSWVLWEWRLKARTEHIYEHEKISRFHRTWLLKLYFSQWYVRYNIRHQQKQQIKSAAEQWIRKWKEQKLKKLYGSARSEWDKRVLSVAFRKWGLQKAMVLDEKIRIQEAHVELNRRRLQTLFWIWHWRSEELLWINLLLAKNRQRQAVRCLDAWKLYVRREALLQHSLKVHRSKMLQWCLCRWTQALWQRHREAMMVTQLFQLRWEKGQNARRVFLRFQDGSEGEQEGNGRIPFSVRTVWSFSVDGTYSKLALQRLFIRWKEEFYRLQLANSFQQVLAQQKLRSVLERWRKVTWLSFLGQLCKLDCGLAHPQQVTHPFMEELSISSGFHSNDQVYLSSEKSYSSLEEYNQDITVSDWSSSDGWNYCCLPTDLTNKNTEELCHGTYSSLQHYSSTKVPSEEENEAPLQSSSPQQSSDAR